MPGEPLAEWAVEIDGSGPRAILAEIMGEWEAGLSSLDELARGTRLQVDSTALADVKTKVDETRAALAVPMGVTLANAPSVAPAAPKATGPEEEAKPLTVQAHLASEPIKLVREQLLAAQKDADGVGAALRLAFKAGEEFKFPDEYRETLQAIQRDFLAGRATAEEAQRGITLAGRSAMEEFRAQEEAKREEARKTREAIQANREAMRGFGSAIMSTAATGGSIAASLLQMQEAQARATGASQEQLFNLQQMGETIPHITSALSSVGAFASGNFLGGALGLTTGLIGLVSALARPKPPLEGGRKEGLEDTFSRIQVASLKNDSDPTSETKKSNFFLAAIDATLRHMRVPPLVS